MFTVLLLGNERSITIENFGVRVLSTMMYLHNVICKFVVVYLKKLTKFEVPLTVTLITFIAEKKL